MAPSIHKQTAQETCLQRIHPTLLWALYMHYPVGLSTFELGPFPPLDPVYGWQREKSERLKDLEKTPQLEHGGGGI